MKQFYKLENTVKPYSWGSAEWIPQLMGVNNTAGAPWAELWMGVHPEGPSQTVLDGVPVSLPDLIQRDPLFFLGPGQAKQFGTLPFLYKLLAAAKPLSIQAHPNLEQAQKGWERENHAGIPLNDPKRNYKDPNHKPEILCALRPFKAMCGFKEPAEIIEGLAAFFQPGQSDGADLTALSPALGAFLDTLKSLLADAGRTEQADALRRFLKTLLEMPEAVGQDLSRYITSRGTARGGKHPAFAPEWQLALEFARLYPGDPAVIAPFYLNVLDLAPGEAVYLPAGILHAYVEGLGVELMANSDNVLRGGLTPKHVDMDELVSILRFAPFKPEIYKPGKPGAPLPSAVFTYPADCREFSLTVICDKNETVPVPVEGPCIALVTEGRARLSGTGNTGAEELLLNQGEAAFIAAGTGNRECSLTGTFTLYVAGIPPLS
ncbi:mannose-6-phosphate isomerase, class I [Spirochaetia bacterium]|nr:mannose-6-phosphate isomerase, class I [Spirochaetia bacterium]